MMQEAFAEAANSRNLLSLGSRHSEIAISTSINAAFARNLLWQQAFYHAVNIFQTLTGQKFRQTNQMSNRIYHNAGFESFIICPRAF